MPRDDPRSSQPRLGPPVLGAQAKDVARFGTRPASCSDAALDGRPERWSTLALQCRDRWTGTPPRPTPTPGRSAVAPRCGMPTPTRAFRFICAPAPATPTSGDQPTGRRRDDRAMSWKSITASQCSDRRAGAPARTGSGVTRPPQRRDAGLSPPAAPAAPGLQTGDLGVDLHHVAALRGRRGCRCPLPRGPPGRSMAATKSASIREWRSAESCCAIDFGVVITGSRSVRWRIISRTTPSRNRPPPRPGTMVSIPEAIRISPTLVRDDRCVDSSARSGCNPSR